MPTSSIPLPFNERVAIVAGLPGFGTTLLVNLFEKLGEHGLERIEDVCGEETSLRGYS
jgi:hypothetical protein